MIKIIEKTPIKCSGITSLFIEFSYNEDVVRVIKSCELAIWHKKEKVWEVPLISLSFLLDNLCYLDDIDLILQNKDASIGIKNEIKYADNLKSTMFKHQEEAVEFGLSRDKWLLLDSPGLGKSLSIIGLANELKERGLISHCLIICGLATLRANWEKEIKLHSNLSYITIGKKISSKGSIRWSTISERARQLKEYIDEFFVIINVESLREEEVVEAINTSVNNFDMIVFDELHKCKSSQSNQGHNLLKLKDSKYKVGLSGTLILNSGVDAYTPLKWIGVEHGTLTNFKNTYCEFGGFGGYQVIGMKNTELLKDELENCSLRRTKDLMSLPPKNIIDEVIEMNESHRKFYEDVKKGIKEECDKIELKPNNLLALTTRLRQATTCPSVLTSNDIIPTKIERCIDLVEEIVEQGDKVVVMSTFKEPIYQLKGLLSKYNPLVGTGDMKDEEVSRNIDLFQTDDVHKVILCTTSKMGTGVTLNRARYMILLDEPWTEALYQQVTDRIHRVNNTAPVFIYNLICENTIDETVSKIINRKKAISEYVIDDKVDNDTFEILKNYIQDL